MLIIHGEHQTASRQFFLDQKIMCAKKGQQISSLSGADLDLPTLRTISNTVSLFGTSNAVFIEGFFSRRPSNDKKAIIEYLTSVPESNVFLWDSKDISSQLKSFPSNTIKSFDLPKYIFKFLDHPDLESLHLCLQSLPPEQIFASLITRMIKNSSSPEKIQELLKIDYAQKTSTSPFDLSLALELFITKA